MHERASSSWSAWLVKLYKIMWREALIPTVDWILYVHACSYILLCMNYKTWLLLHYRVNDVHVSTILFKCPVIMTIHKVKPVYGFCHLKFSESTTNDIIKLATWEHYNQ